MSQPFRPAPVGLKGPAGSERAFLQSRTADLGIESKLGKRRLVTEATPASQVGGYWCETCQCTLRDSATYLDHINGKNHQRRLGFTMRVERSSVDAVRDRFTKLKQGPMVAGSDSGGRVKPTLDAEDRYALAAMDNPSIQVVSGQRYISLGASSAEPSDSAERGASAEHGGGVTSVGGAHGAPDAKRHRGHDAATSAAAPVAAEGDDSEDAFLMSSMGFASFGGPAQGKKR